MGPIMSNTANKGAKGHLEACCSSGASPPANLIWDRQCRLQSDSTEKITCTNCLKSSSHHDFHKNKRKKNGRESWCKKCVSQKKAKKYRDGKKRKIRRKSSITKDTATLTSSVQGVLSGFAIEEFSSVFSEAIRELIDEAKL